MLIILVSGLAVNFRLFIGCHQGEFERGFVAAAETESIVFISAYQAQELWQSRTALFIDARPGDVFAADHIPYAVNIPLNDPDKAGLLAHLGPDGKKPVIILCSGGACLDSVHLAQWLLARKVLDSVRVFQGGWQEWVDLGYPIEASHGAK